ncbi:Rrf2 family transcriptional regulator [Lactiplantibacillus herbarum]|uniref:Rrf2 family transcriptional regulator n=1 Tax=Lactiplantibacillus herbarum TaxID=1670446 RepID=UPI00064F3750|nr:Rrf2 family transcriptional regulator [Lactiplantibacillus herbarum]
MKIKGSVEQGVYVLLMLAIQKDHLPLKSQLLSERLEVSDSYLKKILRKLVVADLIASNASKDGGFTLGRPISEITMLDVCQAVDDSASLQLPTLNLAERVFPGSPEHIKQSTKLVADTFERSQTAFNTELANMTLNKLLESESVQRGVIDWRSLN